MRLEMRGAGGLAAPLLHWLILVSGLALLATGELLDPHTLVLTCFGAVAGTLVGQGAAWLRLRAWAATVTFLGIAFVAYVGLASFYVRPTVVAFLPAAACGYLSLTARGSLAALWFPAVPWSLALIDAESSGRSPLLGRGVLWLALGALLLSALWAREARRIEQWKTHALGPLAEPARRTLLRESPLRRLARTAWPIAIAAATFAVGAWVAPELWQWDRGRKAAEQMAEAARALPPPPVHAKDHTGEWVTCCPEAPPAVEPTRRVREYIESTRIDVAKPALAKPTFAPPSACVACTDGVPVRPVHDRAGSGASAEPGPVGEVAAGGASAVATPPYGSTVGTGRAGDLLAEDAPSKVADGAAAAPIPAPLPATAPPAGLSRPTRTKTASASPAVRPPTSGSGSTRGSGRVASAGSQPVADGADARDWVDVLLAALLALAGAALATNLVLRPVRRWFVLRHLRRPWWNEGVGQRVSNFWQLALIGLRDAGWQTGVDEAPEGLARRVDIPAVATCAAVLERARHGVRVDAADLAAMEQAAAAAFVEARRRAGCLPRLVSWWRAPTG